MRLLVTGGAGFIGSNVILHLIHRPEIARLVNLDCLTYAGRLENLAPVAQHPKYAFVQIDLRNAADVRATLEREAITHVLHLAAETHVDRSIADPLPFLATNVTGTGHLLEACRALWTPRAADRRFVHVSTDEVYGTLGDTGVFTEDSPYAPNSPYSASKASSNLLVRAYHVTYGLPAITANCTNNYGPRQHPEKLIPVVLRSVLERRPIPLYGDGLNVRDWLHVSDTAEALWLALTRGRPGASYNVGGGNEWPNLRIVETLCELVDELAPHLGGRSRQLITFVADRPGHDRRYALDSTRIHTELGWQPACDFATGLRQTVQWYLAHPEWFRR